MEGTNGAAVEHGAWRGYRRLEIDAALSADRPRPDPRDRARAADLERYLPSSRGLAAMLGVNRKTVVLAYEDLIAQGWLTSCGTRGTTVSDVLP
ncbi:GntR family transcriptional regulator [Caulobacter segnis]